jgi:membrane dipeptidase
MADNTEPVQPVIDCHSDIMIDVFRRRRAGERQVLVRRHLPEHRKGGVVAAVCTVGGDGAALNPLGIDRPYESAMRELDAVYADVAESEGAYEVASSAADVERCIARGVFAILPSIEGASPIEGTLDRIREFHERGLRVLGLTWNERNELAIGTDAGEDTGLSDVGAEAVVLMNDLGIVIDLAHASRGTFFDVARLSRAPLFVSHSNASAVWAHPRNIDDDQILAVRASGGIVGVNFYAPFTGPPTVTVEHLLDHIEYYVKTIGVDSTALGPDFIDYAIPELTLEMRRHPGVYPDTRYPVGAETVASLQNVIAGMSRRGLDRESIEKIARGNFLRLLKETQALAPVVAAAG